MIPNPSSSDPAPRADERASEQLAFGEADPAGLGEAQAPNFSIRDYVFLSRSSGDITKNWPFPHKLLQLCFKHGVGELLPPFEPPESVRACCFRKEVESDQQVACSRAEHILTQFESLGIEDVNPADDKHRDMRCQFPEKRKQTNDRRDVSDDEMPAHVPCSVEASRSVSESSPEVEAAQLRTAPSGVENSSDPSKKKCRLILKLSSINETKRAEDIISTSSTISDPMASKVCPVCKIFASTSNTTLNAHIDQCLSSESNLNCALTEILKPKMKPTKKRFMVDIYATALHCTLEDLDRRNGTKWASEPNLMTEPSEACTEAARAKMSPIHTSDDAKPADTRDDGNGGAIYIDSNGIKRCILSKFNSTPPVSSSEHLKMKEHAKIINEGKSLLLSKKCFASKDSNYVKGKPHIKKLSSKFKGEIQAAPGKDHHEEAQYEKEDSQPKISNAPDQIRNIDSVPIRNWVCSKRSDLPKKLKHKEIHNLENSVTMRTQLTGSNRPDAGNSSVLDSHVIEFSSPSENLASSPKTNRVDFLSDTVRIIDDRKHAKPPAFSSKWSSANTLRSGLTLKISRSAGASISSPRNAGENKNNKHMSDNSCDTVLRPSKDCHGLLKAKRSSTMKKMKKGTLYGEPTFSLEVNRDAVNANLSTVIKFRKHRSKLGAGKKLRLPSDASGGVCHSTKHYDPDTTRITKGFRTRQYDRTKSVSSSEFENVMNQESPSGSNMSVSEGDVSTMEKHKEKSLKLMHHDAGVDHIATSYLQAESSAAQGTAANKPSVMKDIGDLIGNGIIVPANRARSSNSIFNSRPPVDEDMQYFSEQPAETLQDKLELEYRNVTNEGVISQSMVQDARLRGEACNYAAQFPELQIETASLQLSGCGLMSRGDTVREAPQDISSLTSVKIIDQDLNLASERQHSGSPISTTSTIFPFPAFSKFKNTEKEPAQADSELAVPNHTSMEVEVFPLAKEPDKFEPCCCSQREDLSRESQFLPQSDIDDKIFPSKGKQTPNLFIAPGMPSSFSSYPGLKTGATIISYLESPTGSTTTTMKTPNRVDITSPSPSPRTQSSSILRLMGKDLMVMNKEESAQLPDNLNGRRLPPPVSGTSIPYHHRQFPGGSVLFSKEPSMVNQLMQVGGISGALQRRPDHQQIQHNLYNCPSVFSTEKMGTSCQCQQRPIRSSQADMASEVILIGESPESEAKLNCGPSSTTVNTMLPIPGSSPMQQWPSSCFQSQSQLLSRDDISCFGPYPKVYPREYASAMIRGEAPDRQVLKPLVFQSPSTSHLNPSLYYSQILR